MQNITIRFEDEVAEELNKLSYLLGLPKNKVVNLAVRDEFSKFDTDPKLQEAIEKLTRLRETLESFAQN